MSINHLMEAFGFNDVEIDPIASTDVKTRLKKVLYDTAKELDRTGEDDIVSVATELGRAIEKVTGKKPYEVLDFKLEWDLLEHKSIKHTIEKILDDICLEEREEVEESFTSSETRADAEKMALELKKENPFCYAILYGVQFPGEKHASFFPPQCIDSEEDLKHRVGDATTIYAVFAHKEPKFADRHNREELVKELLADYDNYQGYVYGDYTANNDIACQKLMDGVSRKLSLTGINKESVYKILDLFDLDSKKEFEEELRTVFNTLTEDTVKRGGYWVNKGKEGTHGKFKTKKEADAQRKAMFARGYKESCSTSGLSFVEKLSDPDFSPEITGKAYKVFKVKNGKLYPPMVANVGGEATPVGVWIDAEEGEFAGLSKTGRPKVKSVGGGTLAYRPGWHLGELPIAKQFYRTNKETGEREFPKDFVWAECDYVADIDYQDEAMSYGYTPSGKFQHSLAGLPKLPKGGAYRYRTNPDPETVPWIITGAIKVNKLLDDADVAEILSKHGIEAPKREGGNKTLKELGLTQVGG